MKRGSAAVRHLRSPATNKRWSATTGRSRKASSHPNAAVADHLDRLLTTGEPRTAKALIRELVAELRINGKAEIQPSYYLATPEVCATSEKVGREGVEPPQLTRRFYSRIEGDRRGTAGRPLEFAQGW